MPKASVASLLALACSVAAAAVEYDFVVVGAGTAGLVIAARLSENPKVTVAVIEPGTDQRDNVLVTETNSSGSAFGTPLDWGYSTVVQPDAGNRSLGLHAGKAWGGTSAINGK